MAFSAPKTGLGWRKAPALAARGLQGPAVDSGVWGPHGTPRAGPARHEGQERGQGTGSGDVPKERITGAVCPGPAAASPCLGMGTAPPAPTLMESPRGASAVPKALIGGVNWPRAAAQAAALGAPGAAAVISPRSLALIGLSQEGNLMEKTSATKLMLLTCTCRKGRGAVSQRDGEGTALSWHRHTPKNPAGRGRAQLRGHGSGPGPGAAPGTAELRSDQPSSGEASTAVLGCPG